MWSCCQVPTFCLMWRVPAACRSRLLQLKDGASAELRSCTLAYAGQSGVCLAPSAPCLRLSLREEDPKPAGPEAPAAPELEPEASEATSPSPRRLAMAGRVSLHSTRVFACGGHGVYVRGAGSVTAMRCVVSETSLAVAWAEGGACMVLNDCKLSSSASGEGVFACGAGTRVHAQGGELYRNAGCGAHAGAGARMELVGCEVYSNQRSGCVASGTGSQLTVQGGSVVHNGAHGVAADACASLHVEKVMVAVNARDGVAVDGAGTRGSVAECTVLDNRDGGVTVTGGAHATVDGCKLSGAGQLHCFVLSLQVSSPSQLSKIHKPP